MARTTRYDARSIDVLEGIEAVRKRPGMYIGGTGSDGLHHMLWEIVDNAIDEAMNGHATSISVTLHSDGSTCTVDDNGRGIPVDEMEKLKKSALEVILTTLHAGGKFNSGVYKTSGGLHGVGSSAVNALSLKFSARIRREGQEWVQHYRRGRPKAPVRLEGPARGTGSRITFTPDPSIFEDTIFDADLIRDRLEVKAFLNKGLRIVFRDQVSKKTHTLQHAGGLEDFLTVTLERLKLNSCLDAPFLMERNNGIHTALAVTWTNHTRERLRSYVNGIPTRDGGTHEQGFREAVVKALRSFIKTHDLQPRGVSLSADDLREGMVVLLSVLHPDPQFQGQTKNRLNNPDVRHSIDQSVRPALEQWLHDNPTRGRLIVSRGLQAARARDAAKQAANAVRRKSATSHRLNLPGKLADCSSSNATECELFIVEGDSAGGSAKQARDRRTQAILPLRGKVLNAEQASLKKLLANEELNNVVTALGCGMGRDFKESRLRYQRVILLMDADSDGHHITTLLLTFLFRHMRPLIEKGYVYLAMPPLFRINAGNQTHWALDDNDRERILASLPARLKTEITRFKGLGEMPPKTLFDTTLDPTRRRLQQVDLSDPILADSTIADLMGKDPSSRYRFIMEQAAEVESIDV
ncbi:MAG: DNA gyrase subunit B [Proteobacteria bacterium]|nr:DNA gyrase subunit B [Pseudomonadota bacterium]